MELASETDHNNEEWFDPHPGEDFECKGEQVRQKILSDEEVKLAAEAGPQDQQRTGQHRNTPTDLYPTGQNDESEI